MRKPADQFSISKNGIDFIAHHEGFKPTEYTDSVGHPTIGYGHELQPGQSYPGGITQEQAQQLLQQDIAVAENEVRNNVAVDITQNQFDALTSLAYNIGGRNFENSTLLQSLNDRNYDAAGDHFLDWNKVRDPLTHLLKPDSGLTDRRHDERILFLRGIY